MAKAPETFSIRGAARYLETLGVEVGEMRIRTLLRQHEIFTKDPNTTKAKLGDSEVETWAVSKAALDQYAAAAKGGQVRTSSGAKAYRVNATAEQLEKLRKFAADNGMGEPVRANKAYTKKSNSPASAGDSDTPIGSDGLDGLMSGDDTEDGLFDEQPEAVTA